MQEHQLGEPELRDVIRGYGQIAIQPDVLDDFFDRLVFPQELVGRLDSDSWYRVEVVTACQNL